jgi:hypothetical protein
MIHFSTPKIFASAVLKSVLSNSSHRASLERLHCASRSTKTVLYQCSANFTAVLYAMVVLPTHHLLLKKTSFLVLVNCISEQTLKERA